MPTLDTLAFDNRYARLPGALFQPVRPTPLPAPYLVAFSEESARLLDLDPSEATRADLPAFFGGSKQLPGSEPLAMLYAGHQFGTYVPQLGDGRAILLGQVRGQGGASWDLHLKGAGPTAFSRGGDGRSVLRSAVREFLCSEAMAGLGIPTTRSLCLVGSDLPVYREEIETAATLVRLAPSHVRFGHFEVLYYRRELDLLRILADHVISEHYPHLAGAPDRYARFLAEVVERTARLVAQWQSVGFAHGVLNTDNMSILGLTLDYGPFGFQDTFDAGFICNHSDHHGRYAFEQQPPIGQWNTRALAQALLPLMTREAALEALDRYEPVFVQEFARLMRAKLGLATEQDGDGDLAESLLILMHHNQLDFTQFFRLLGTFDSGTGALNAQLRDHVLDRAAFDAWAARYRERLQFEGSADAERKTRMDRANPKYVLRNYLAHQAIEKAKVKDFSELATLQRVLARPFDEQPEFDRYAAPPPDWGRALELSCSS